MTEALDEVAIISALQSIHLFAEMDYEHIATVFKAGGVENVPSGTVLCEANTIDERLIVFLQGAMRLETAAGERIDTIEPVRVIGEMGVFTGQPRSTRVVAEQECAVMFLGQEVWAEIFESDPDVGIQMQTGLIKDLYARIHDMNAELQKMREEQREDG